MSHGSTSHPYTHRLKGQLMRSGIRRLTARSAVTAMTAGLIITGVAAAPALAFGPALGSAVVEAEGSQTPGMGVDASPMHIVTPGPCPNNPQVTNAQVFMFGSGFPVEGYPVTANNSIGILPASPSGGYDITLLDTLQNFAAAQSPPAVLSGEYVFYLECKHYFGSTDYGDYQGSIFYTDPTHWTNTPPASSYATTTTLTVAPASPQLAGTPVVLNAAVTPAGSGGTVQFRDGAAALGAPAAVTAGHATLSTAALAVGTHSLSAVFTPTTPAGGVPSTSAAVSFVVTTPLPVLTAAASLTVPVGTALSCNAGAIWLRDGVTISAGTSYRLTAADLGHKISCKVGAFAGPTAVVVPGGPLKALIAPSLAGRGKVGTKLVLKPGLWSPALVTKSVVWKRDGKVIAKQTGPFYVVKKTDKGHRISAVVTAKRPGFASGVASTSGVAGKPSARSGAPLTVKDLAASTADAGAGSAVGFTLPVGTAVSCLPASFTGAVSVSTTLLVNGVATVLSTVPDADLGKTLTCESKATNASGSVVSDASVVIVTGANLVAYVRPHIAGVAKVGKKLVAVVGKWTPVQTKATFVWLRNGKAIKGATKAFYVATKADKKARITVRVTASRTGWGTGKAVSAAVSIR